MSKIASRYSAVLSNQALVDALYQNALHRAPDAAGYNLDLSPHLGIIPTISGPVA